MLTLDSQTRHAGQRRLTTNLAHSETEVLEAQRMRHKALSEEMGANLPGANEGSDRDISDKYCKPLLVRESDGNKVVGTYRILPPDQPQKIGGYAKHFLETSRLYFEMQPGEKCLDGRQLLQQPQERGA